MIWIFSLLILVISGCQSNPVERHYTEVIVQVPEAAMPSDPHAGLDMSSMSIPEGMEMPVTSMNTMYSWIAPEGWMQLPGQGMRLASFHLRDHKEDIDCSVISLAGVAGGLEANLKRWMGQIGIESSAADLAALINAAGTIKIKGGQEGKVFDFTTIQLQAQAEDQSMIVVMLSMNEATLFVKMTGSIGHVTKHKQDFFKLVQSIESKDNS